MERDIYKKLQKWKTFYRRKPLILNGSRQVGKTYALEHFAKESYEKYAYFNFEKDKTLSSFFTESLDPKELIKNLSIHSSIDIEPENTLIIFDEIQECDEALNSLKYFCEEAGDYHIAAAGSLLGIKVAGGKGFPVGKVNFMNLFPLNFFEFLTATDNGRLREYLETITELSPLPDPHHNNLKKLLKYYCYVGGMPEAVSEYISHEKLDVVREVHLELLFAYEKDFAKHAPLNQITKITTIWNQIPEELAKENKKFIFANIRKSARSRDYEEAIQWLLDAGLIYKSDRIETPKVPLTSYRNSNIFKLFFIDVGLLGAMCRLSAKTMIDGDKLFTEFKGAFTENYVAQELKAVGCKDLFYWASQGEAEVDFVLEIGGKVFPLEAKAGVNKKKKSLLIFGEKYKPMSLLRSTLMNLKQDKNIKNYPLYMVKEILKSEEA